MRTLYIDAVGFWAPPLPSWHAARAAFRGEGALLDPPLRRPAPRLLASAERRRAPDGVALALEVASEAVAASGHAATELASVFTSAHGDLAITDAMCSTLARTPMLVSPTRFHNSVHNAASGYWTMATGCMQASTAVSAFEHSFAAGLLEACAQCATDERAVLLVGCDVEACGPLARVNRSRGLLALALVLAPTRSERSVAALNWSLAPGEAAAPAPRSPAAEALADNAMADGLPLFEALATARGDAFTMPLTASLALAVRLDHDTACNVRGAAASAG